MIAAEFAFSVELARDDAFGQAIFSRLPFAEPARNYPEGSGWREPQMRAVVEVGGTPEHPERARRVVLMNVHVLPPVDLSQIIEQRGQVEKIARICEREIAATGALVVAGDFNAAPGTAHIRAMERAGLAPALNVAAGRASTWPRTSWLRALPGVRLDHILVGPAVGVEGAGVCGDIGSDHAPVWAVLRIAPGGIP